MTDKTKEAGDWRLETGKAKTERRKRSTVNGRKKDGLFRPSDDFLAPRAGLEPAT